MENRPLISYVVTTYNIEQSVRCAFAQTYSPLEIVLSDDCSNDRTFDIMKKLADEYRGPHKIVLNQNVHNLGITQHMNKAYLELATGELIVAAHGDDLSLPERTEKSYEYLRAHPDMTAVSFSIDAVNERGEALKAHSAVVDEIHTYEFSSLANIPAPSRCFYKRVMESFGPLNQDCPTEDELISFRALLLGKNAFLPEHMVQYRKHGGSSSNPENFSRFPLEKILKQQDQDMEKAVNMGLLSESTRREVYKRLEDKMLIRKKYRKYFASRSLKDLFTLVMYSKVSFGMKLYYLKAHWEYMSRHE